MIMRSEQENLLEAVAAFQPAMQAENLALDQNPAFPARSFERLREAGLLRASLREDLGGLGFGSGEAGALALCRLLALLGEGSLSVARLYEAHVNALLLVQEYGRQDLTVRVAEDAREGHIFALWVTDPAEGGLCLTRDEGGFRLVGSKAFCSGAGFATRALVTAETPAGKQMLIVNLEESARVLASNVKLGGMRAAVTGSMDFSGMRVDEGALLGNAGDYLREPVFSAGAWRGSAASLGALRHLVELHRQGLLKRERDSDPYQEMRFGQVMMAYETARLWAEKAALYACLGDRKADAVVAYVNLARLAVEAACLNAMRLTQRSLGLSAFMAGAPVEILCRDLSTYLRQPAPDELLATAARFYFGTGTAGL